MSFGGGGGGSNTVTQVQQIPDWAQDLARSNVDIASSLASRPFTPYGAEIPSSGPIIYQYDSWIPNQSAIDQQESAAFKTAWEQGKIPGSPGYVLPSNVQSWGQSPLRNQILAGLVGYTGEWGSGQNSAWLAQQPQAIQDLETTFIDEWNAGKIPGSPGYVIPAGQDWGGQELRNQYLTGLTGYTGNFGPIFASDIAQTPGISDIDLLVAPLTSHQRMGMEMSINAADNWQDDLASAEGMLTSANSPWNSSSAAEYMNPFTMASLQPQLQEFDLQQAMRRKQLGASATQAGAFGDARHGVEDVLGDFYGSLARNDIIAQGMNDAYGAAMSAFQSDKARQQQGAGMMANLGAARQGLGLQGGQAIFDVGTQEQQINQQKLTTAYNNYLNQLMWPVEQLNMRIAALANTPYTVSNFHSLAPSNATAQNIGAFSALAGGLGSLLNGNNGSGGFFNTNF